MSLSIRHDYSFNIQLKQNIIFNIFSLGPNIVSSTSVSNVTQQQSNSNNPISLGSGTYFYENSPTSAVAATVPGGFSNQQISRGSNYSNQQGTVSASTFTSTMNQQHSQQSQVRSIGASVHGKYLLISLSSCTFFHIRNI